jgi:RND family efflux transporter MFP subunit
MMRMRTVFAASVLLVLAACGSGQKAAELPPLPKLDTISVQAGAAAQGRAWDGVIEAVQQADLSAQTAGRVVAVDADVNDRVAAGTVLLRLTAVEQQAGANVARAQLHAAEAAAAEAEATFARYSALAAKQLVSRLQIDQLRTARDSAVAARDAARAQLAQAGQQADYTVVRAPFAGIVSARRVEPGESIANGQPLMSVYAPGALRIQVQVPQSDADAIRVARHAQVVLADGRSVDATEVTVFPSADPATHSVSVRVILPALKDPPQPGATAKVVFAMAGGAAVLEIPRSALVERGEISGVYVLDGNRLALRQLRLGQGVGSRVEVLAGLSSGETIAVDPVAAQQALAAQRKAAGNSGE